MFVEINTEDGVKKLCEILETDKVTNTNVKEQWKITRGDESIKVIALKKPKAGQYVEFYEVGNAIFNGEIHHTSKDIEPSECETCAELAAQIKELEEDKELLLEQNSALQEENEALRDGSYQEPFEYNPEKLEDMNFKEAKAACEDGKTVTRDCWKGVYMTHDEKKGLMSHVRGTNPKPLAIDKASLEAKDFFVMENI